MDERTWWFWLAVVVVGLAAGVVGFAGYARWQAAERETAAVNSLLNVVGYNLQIGTLKPVPKEALVPPVPVPVVPPEKK